MPGPANPITGKTDLSGGPESTIGGQEILHDVNLPVNSEARAIDLDVSGTLGSGENLVGYNVNVTPAGSGGAWVSAFYGKVTQIGSKAVNGYISAAELEVVLGGTYDCMDWAVLVLNSNDDNAGGAPTHKSYIMLREYGDRAMDNLFCFYDATRASASDAELVSQAGSTPFNTYVRFLVGETPVWLLATIGGPATAPDLKMVGTTVNQYVEWDASADKLNLVFNKSGQSTENQSLDITMTTDSSFLTGTDITFSGGRGSSMVKLTGTYTGLGGFEGIHAAIATRGELVAAGAGVIVVKGIVTNTAALAEGNIYGAQFIAKHDSDENAMTAQACLVGLEAIGYDAAVGSAGVGVMLGLNAVIRSYATAPYGGGVHRGIQIVVDEATLGADEVTGLCIWNMGASAIDGIRIVGAATMANFLYLDAAGGAVKTGSLKGSGGADILCDAYLVCSIGGTPYYSPLYDSLNT